MVIYQDKSMPECQVVLKRCDDSIFKKSSEIVVTKRNHDKNLPQKCITNPKTCKICWKVLSKSNFKTHLLRHKKIKNFQCSFCSSKFTTQTELERHVRVHTQERPIKCNICEMYVSNFENLYVHESTHFNSKYFTTSHTLQQFKNAKRDLQITFTCFICQDAFENFKGITNHISPYVKCLKCTDCGNGFATLDEKQKHLEDTENEFECKFCFKKLLNFCELTKHQATHTDKELRRGENIQCTKCPSLLSNIPAFKRHMQNVHPDDDAVKKCKDCECSFKNEFLFSLHSQMAHRSSSERKRSIRCHICKTQVKLPSSDNVKEYAKHIMKKHIKCEPDEENKENVICIYCNGIYSIHKDYRELLLGHVQRHITHPGNNDISLPCKECKLTFGSYLSLKQHKRFKHTSSDGFKCYICGQAKKQWGELTNHLKRHLKEKSYKCEECGKSWVTLGDLQKHLKSHKGTRNYPCQFCGKTFKIVENRRRHENTVHSESKVSCEVCSKEFSHWNYLRDHMVIHSETKNFKCKFCDKAYQSRPNMYRHMRESHKK